MAIALLAYGSLQWDPDEQLKAGLDFSAASPTTTPFAVEFARSSQKRAGAPTLVPVSGRGAPVPALLVPFREGLTGDEAKTLVWQRETRNSDGRYPNPSVVGPNTVVIEEFTDRASAYSSVLYVRLAADSPDLDPQTLARLAIQSVTGDVGAMRRDGISYLSQAKRFGIATPLTAPYEESILTELAVRSLDDAWSAALSRQNASR